MPLPLENAASVPNAVYTPSIFLSSVIVDGRLVVKAKMVLASARCDDGVWSKASGPSGVVEINDVENLPEDLAAAVVGETPAPLLIGQIMTGIIQLVGAVNAVRKIV